MSNLENVAVLVAVFAMPECGACEAYLPRFYQRVEAHRTKGFPFVIYEPGKPMPARSIPVLVLDVSSKQDNLQDFADRFDVGATPTTIVAKRGVGVLKAEGNLDDRQIDAVLGLARQHAL